MTIDPPKPVTQLVVGHGDRGQGALDLPETVPLPAACAVSVVVAEHGAKVWRTLRFLGVREADLDDACQEVFIVISRKLSSFENRARVSTWIYSICRKVAAAHRRKAHVRFETPSANAVRHDTAAGDAGSCPARMLQQRQELKMLHAALSSLSPQLRETFVLCEIERLTLKDASFALNAPLQTVYSRLKAARQSVTQFIKQAEPSKSAS